MLKKLGIIISLLLVITLFSNRVQAADNYFVWDKTTINVGVGESVEKELDKINVTFYYIGVKTEEKVRVKLDTFYYGSLSIGTSTPETKKVKVLATVSGYSSYDRREIEVKIVDNVAPEIIQIGKLTIGYNEPINYNDYFKAKDNYAIESLIFIDDYVNQNVPGIYPLKVIAIDKAGNKVERNFNVNIVDLTKPVLLANTFIEVAYGDLEFDIRDYVKATDDYDGDITSKIECKGLDIFKLGKQNVILEVKDASGNIISINQEITVIDNKAPELELEEYNVTTMISETNIDFTRYIKSTSDNCDNLTIYDVEIDYSEFRNEIGQYKIYYHLKDSSGNYIIRTLTINVSFDNPPEIIASNFTVPKNEPINWNDYISVTDLYDVNIKESLIINANNVDIKTPGVYEVIIEATNVAGIKTTKVIYVTVKDENILNESSDIYTMLYNNRITIIVIIIGITAFIVITIRKKTRKNGI